MPQKDLNATVWYVLTHIFGVQGLLAAPGVATNEILCKLTLAIIAVPVFKALYIYIYVYIHVYM